MREMKKKTNKLPNKQLRKKDNKMIEMDKNQ